MLQYTDVLVLAKSERGCMSAAIAIYGELQSLKLDFKLNTDD